MDARLGRASGARTDAPENGLRHSVRDYDHARAIADRTHLYRPSDFYDTRRDSEWPL